MRSTLRLLSQLMGTLTAQAQPPLDEQALSQLELRMDTIQAELNELAQFSLRSGVGSIGYRSGDHKQPNALEWVQIDLEQAVPIDQIVLVPSIWRDTKSGFSADNFPVAFQIIAGIRPDTQGAVIASFSASDQLLPRIAPLIIPCATTASWVRLEATILSPRAFDGHYSLDLAEILIFNGQENLALNQPVTASSHNLDKRSARAPDGLVDGFVPYLMDAAQGTQSVAFFKHYDSKLQPILRIDLGTLRTVNAVYLHSIDISDTIPQRFPSDFAMPRHLLIEGASRPDYSDAHVLIDHRIQSVFETGPILMLDFPETDCRYLRLTALEPYIDSTYSGILHGRIGFAEIEILSAGNNVAQGHSFSADLQLAQLASNRLLSALTDGRNLYGNILPLRYWLEQLARRHDLETERPALAAELERRYARQKTNMNRLAWLAALLAAGIGFTILIDRMLRMRQIVKIRERFAADLHDELGANLHTIGLLSDLAEEAQDSPSELSMLHQRIRKVTEQTGTAVRHCTDLLEAEGLYTALLGDMERAARRIMAKFSHEISVEGEAHLAQLKPRTRADLFLFYKECLVNISRHSDATEFSTQLTASPKQIQLSVHDNGRGIAEAIPKSLKRRAKLLRGKMRVESPVTGGTTIHLTLRIRRNQRNHV